MHGREHRHASKGVPECRACRHAQANEPTHTNLRPPSHCTNWHPITAKNTRLRDSALLHSRSPQPRRPVLRVSLMRGRLELYSMRILPGTGIVQAKLMVLASEFPRNAKITWFKRKDTCAQMLVPSKTLERTRRILRRRRGRPLNPRDASHLTLTTATWLDGVRLPTSPATGCNGALGI